MGRENYMDSGLCADGMFTSDNGFLQGALENKQEK